MVREALDSLLVGPAEVEVRHENTAWAARSRTRDSDLELGVALGWSDAEGFGGQLGTPDARFNLGERRLPRG